MFPGNASILHTFTDPAGDASVSATTRVLENNAAVTDLVCTNRLGGVCSAVLLLSDTNDNHYGVDQSVGWSPAGDVVWWRKENLHQALNPAYVGSCDPHTPLQSTERRFTVDAGGDLRMANGSCTCPGSRRYACPSYRCTRRTCPGSGFGFHRCRNGHYAS
eukprot:SAG11_NODE_124_length_15798_cov_14.675776_15_plen_161_part_00